MKANQFLFTPKFLIVPIAICFAYSIVGNMSCTSKSDVTSPQNNTAMLTDAPLPPGISAMEDEVNLPETSTDNTAPLGNNDGSGTSTISKVNMSDAELLKRKFKNLLIFHADETMHVNKPTLATLILSHDAVLGKLKTEVLTESDAEDDGYKMDTLLEIGNKMKARLIPFGSSKDNNCFAIEALGDDVQSFRAERKKIIWQWKVIPLKPGKQELKLSIQIIEKDGEASTLPARNIEVLIFAKPESYMTKIGDFFEKYWQFLITAILIPIITAWVTNIIKNRGGKLPKEKPAPKPPAAKHSDDTHAHY